MEIKYKQKFHPIGQGLFYSSSVNIEGRNNANIIFDCGSNDIKKIKDEIDEIDKLDNYNIDVLIISHLDYDHISGLDYLLNKKNVFVKNVVLPYLYPQERNLLQILNKIKKNLYNFNAENWYDDFIQNPYIYLNEQGNVRNIIIINGTGDGEGDGNNYYVDFPSDGFPHMNDNLDENNFINKLQKTNNSTKNDFYNNERINLNNNKKFKLVTDRGYILVANIFLAFFNYKISDNKLNDFYNDLKQKFNITDLDSIVDILKNPTERKKLKASYKQIYQNLNLTSLAAYQGFLIPFYKYPNRISIHSNNFNLFNFLNCCDCDGFIDGEFHCHYHGRLKRHYYCKVYCDCCCDCCCDNNNRCNLQIGTLLLGDIKLDYINRQKQLFTHFKKLLPYVSIVQLSHHGAKDGWNGELLWRISKNALYIASHGENNKYNHPDKSVILELAENNRKFISVTENNKFYNEIEFDIN